MKNYKRIMAVAMVACLAFAFTACGDKKEKGGDAAGTEEAIVDVEPGMYLAHFDSSTTNPVPAYQFVGGDMSENIPAGTQMDLTLTLKEDGTYMLYVSFTNENNPDSDDEFYVNVYTTANGKYSLSGNTATIETPEMVSTGFAAGSDALSKDSYKACSFDNGKTGDWTSTDNASVLACVPATTFTVENGAIVTWEPAGSETGNPNN